LFAAFDIIKEDKVYQRYFTLYDRKIRFPSSKERPVSCLPTYLCYANLVAFGNLKRQLVS